jgi:DNA-binding beta-propeller fold protein YncE
MLSAICALGALFSAASCQTLPTSSAGEVHGLHVQARFSGPDGGWDFSTFDRVHRRVYVSRSDGITVLDLASGAVTPRLVAGSRTHIALPINDGSEILVTNGASGGAFIANALTGAIRVASIPTGTKPDAAMLEPRTGLVWVLDNANGGIAIIDPHAGSLIGRIAVEGALESPVSDGAGKVYITVEDKAEIIAVDVRSRMVTAHYPLAGCEGPTGLAYDPRSRRLVVECANGVAKIVDARDGAILGSLLLGPRPDGLIYDARRSLVFAPTGGDATMVAIDPARMQSVASVATQTGARSGAIDSQTEIIYLPSGQFAPAATPGGRPTLVPGSFQILAISGS